ncbi:MAG: helix-turn-helix domain-containing protein [Clostridia bacterium]|nr:helix-turn-helix domain-containing protein [Clostridia bacterium]
MSANRLANHDHYYYTHSDFFNNSLDLVHAFLMRDYEIGMHEQEFYEINIVTKGNGIHYIDNSCVNASMGDVFIIPPKIGHGYVGGKDFDVFHVILSDSFMNKYIADLQQLPSFYTLFGAEPLMRGKTVSSLHLTLPREELETTLKILNEIEYYKKYNDPVESMLRNSFAMVSIGLLCNAYSTSYPNGDPLLGQDRALMESISFIHEHYFEKITIEDLTRIAHMSRSSYIKKFKMICKMPPSAYITKIRTESATVMLLSTDISISEIAVRTGFYDASHFIKAFEGIYSKSPVAYRNENAQASLHTAPSSK